MNRVIFGRSLFFFSCLIASSLWAGSIDSEAFGYESKKIIEEVNCQRIHQSYNALQDELDRLDSADHFDCAEISFDDDSEEPLEESSIIKSGPCDDELYEMGIQRAIFAEIAAFEKESPLYGAEVKRIKRTYRDEMRDADSEFLPSNLAFRLGNFFASNLDTEHAERFYRLSERTMRSCGEGNIAIGQAYVAYYNEIITRTRPKAPTAELFSAVQKARRAYSLGSDTFDIADHFVDALTKIRDGMVRWPLSPQRIAQDSWYGPAALLKKLYATGFVDALLTDIRMFETIFRSTKFNASKDPDNLLNVLYDAGFYCQKNYYLGSEQFIWVNQKGFLVRVKKNQGGLWEYTVGLTNVNPFIWKEACAIADVKPKDLNHDVDTSFLNKAYSHRSLSTYQYNEIAKVIVDNGMLKIIPATMKDYWYLSVNTQQTMNEAHRPIRAVKDNKEMQKRYGFAIEN